MEVTLTFDNGPEPAVTPRVLEILEKQRILATFFVLGSAVDGREVRAGASALKPA
jgi:peptidoglycan-N-acetylglucosamine deacetylase